jgi:glycerate kinase
VALAGVVRLSDADLRAAGFAAAHGLGEVEPDPERCRTDTGRVLADLAARVLPPLVRP